MRKLGSWTVIFRGNYFRNIANMLVVLYNILIWIFRVAWQIVRWLLRIMLFIVGINWFELERYIQRKIRIYFT